MSGAESEPPTVLRRETFAVAPAAQYRGTFATAAPEPRPGGILPPGWEGLYFPYDAPLAELRPDGSPVDRAVLPEIELPRRLYAGEDTVFHRPLRFGDEVEQAVSLAGLARKQGRAGELVFADVERRYSVDGELAVTSVWHDVFLGAGAPARPPEPVEGAWAHEEELRLDSRQLLRFSAITFNTHRVHFDREWAVEREGLPGLLVHGPLTRILLLDAVARAVSDRALAAFELRSHAPVIVDTPLRLLVRDGEAALTDAAGGLLARAAYRLAD